MTKYTIAFSRSINITAAFKRSSNAEDILSVSKLLRLDLNQMEQYLGIVE